MLRKVLVSDLTMAKNN